MKWEKRVRGRNQRIDKYLFYAGLHISRSQIKRLVDEKRILVNGSSVKPSYVVKDGDEITVDYKPPTSTVIPQNIPLNIIYEDEYLIVVNKPAGIVVHPAKGNLDSTLVNALLYHTKNQLSNINTRERPGVLHRLDKETSGVLVFAKEDITHRGLAEQIEKRTMKRVYVSLVWGKVGNNRGTIETPIGRHIIDRKRMAVTPFASRRAITHYWVIERFPYATYIKLKLHTGRTHQIRVHMEYLGYPVIGDAVYGGRKKGILLNIGIGYKTQFENILQITNRQMLHAALLGFYHPIKKKFMEFTSPLPFDFNRVLNFLRENR